MIRLGDRVKDTVTGFKGIATSRHEYLNGCVRWGVTEERIDKGKDDTKVITFDQLQLEGVLKLAGERM